MVSLELGKSLKALLGEGMQKIVKICLLIHSVPGAFIALASHLGRQLSPWRYTASYFRLGSNNCVFRHILKLLKLLGNFAYIEIRNFVLHHPSRN